MNPRRIALTAAVSIAAVLAAAPAALASTVTVQSGNRIVVNGPGNEKNQISISYGGDAFVVHDSAGVTPGGTCTPGGQLNTAICPAAGIASVRVTAGGGGDIVTLLPGWPAGIEADIDGGSGNDSLYGGAGADSITGGSGRDVLDGRAGADDLRGGSDSGDAVYYGDRTTPLIVTVGSGNDNDGNELDQTANDRDTVHTDVEAVIGGSANDILIGDRTNETFFGGLGDDSIQGGGGNDLLQGFLGNDFLSGDSGNDTVRGAAGADRLLGGDDSDRLAGGPDNDLLRGGPGVDAMKGKGGIDVIQARDGFTDLKINCGPGPNGPERAKRDRRLDPRAKSC